MAGLVGSEFSALAAGFAATVLVARILGPSGRGIVALATTATVFAAAVGSAGLGNALSVETGRAGARTGAALALGLVMVVGVPLAIAWAIVGMLGEPIWHLADSPAAALFGVGMLLLMVLNLLRGVLIGAQRFGDIARGRTVFAVMLITSSGTLAVAGLLTAPSAIGATFLAIGGQAAWYWLRLDRPRRGSLPSRELRTMAGFAVRSQPGMIFQAIAYRYDLILVGVLLTATDAGLYAVAIAMAELCWVAIDAAGIIVLGRAARDQPAVTHGTLAIRATVFMAFAQALVLLAAAPFLVPAVFGGPFSDAFAPLAAMLPGVVMLGAWRVAMNDAAGRGRPGIQSLSASLGAAVAIPLYLWAIPEFGIVGAGAVSSVSYAITACSGMALYSRSFRIPVRRLILPTRADVTEIRRGLLGGSA